MLSYKLCRYYVIGENVFSSAPSIRSMALIVKHMYARVNTA